MTPKPTASESRVQSLERLRAARRGATLWRNNVGAGTLASGNHIRFGLGNDSSQVNARMKSSDLIGIEPVLITPDMVGKTIGRFVAVECKAQGWQYTGTEREVAQKKFIDIVNAMGGNARFCSNAAEDT